MEWLHKSMKAVWAKTLITFFSIIPLIFQADCFNQKKVDVYVFVEKYRYPENIAYDIFWNLVIIMLYYTVYDLIPERKYKRYSFPFLLIAILGLPMYFLFYSKMVSLFFIPILVVMLLIAYVKNKNERKTYCR